MTPTFTTEFDLVAKKLIVTDTFNYVDSVIDEAFGNVTVKIGNQILHTNTNFNSSADIVFGVNNSFEIDLPLNADGTIRETDYEVIYDVRFASNTVADVAADTFTVVTIPTNVGLATLINESIAAGVGMKAVFNVGSTSGYPILSATSTTLTFASITISGAGTGLTTARVESTSNSETTESYNFCDITPISDLCVTSDCFYATLTAQDTTPYLANQTIVSRALTINWPRLANGNAVDTPIVTSEASQTIGPNLYTGGYLVTLSTDITWTQTDGLIVTNTVAARSDYTVNCEGSICSAFNCIKAYAVKYQQAVALGSRDLAQFTAQNFQILLYCNLYNIAVECQNTAEARAVLVALGEYMTQNGVTVQGCDCGCGQSTSNTTEPTVIYPLYNSAVYNSATELARGIIELATTSEAIAGTDDERAMTPLKTKQVLDDRIASQAQAELAASATTADQVNNTQYLTPRGWRWAWDKAKLLAQSFVSLVSFQSGIQLGLNTSPQNEGELWYENFSFKGYIENIGIVTLLTNKSSFNPANQASGTTIVILNETSGIIEFTNVLGPSASGTYILQNLEITVDSVIQASLIYTDVRNEILVLCSYSIPSDGIAYFNMSNLGVQASNSFKIQFQIIA